MKRRIHFSNTVPFASPRQLSLTCVFSGPGVTLTLVPDTEDTWHGAAAHPQGGARATPWTHQQILTATSGGLLEPENTSHVYFFA